MRSPNDEGSQFSKFHFPCNKEEGLVLNSFFREYNLYLKKTLNLFKVAYHPVSCSLHLHTHIILLSLQLLGDETLVSRLQNVKCMKVYIKSFHLLNST